MNRRRHVETTEPTAIVYVGSASSDVVSPCTRFGRRWECECAAFAMNGTCKHTGVAEDAARGAKFDGVRVEFAR